ncbi:hypothetical protein BSNK01_18480 [Bacillaceae bacterium]
MREGVGTVELGRVNQGGMPAIGKELTVQASQRVENSRNPQTEQQMLTQYTPRDPQANEKRPVLSKETARKTVEAFNDLFVSAQSHLKFVFHEKADEYYVQIIDDRTHEVIKEIPPKKLLDLVAAIKEKLGLIIDEKI